MSPADSTALPAGTVAPDFSLPATSGDVVTLSRHRGRKRVLLAFFPAAFTSVCTSELCALSDDFDAFIDADVEVLPISVDTIAVLKDFRTAHDMRVQLLSDEGGIVARQYGAMWTDGMVANRAYFLIDREGVVQWAHAEQHPGLRRDNAEILKQINSVTT
jgi:peroxiredoxin